MLTLAETTAAVLGFSIFPKDTSTCGPLEQEERQIHGPDLTFLHHFTLETFQTKQSTHPDDSLTKLLQPSSCAERTRKPNIPFLLHFNGYQGTLGIIVKFY